MEAKAKVEAEAVDEKTQEVEAEANCHCCCITFSNIASLEHVQTNQTGLADRFKSMIFFNKNHDFYKMMIFLSLRPKFHNFLSLDHIN